MTRNFGPNFKIIRKDSLSPFCILLLCLKKNSKRINFFRIQTFQQIYGFIYLVFKRKRCPYNMIFNVVTHKEIIEHFFIFCWWIKIRIHRRNEKLTNLVDIAKLKRHWQRLYHRKCVKKFTFSNSRSVNCGCRRWIYNKTQ